MRFEKPTLLAALALALLAVAPGTFAAERVKAPAASANSAARAEQESAQAVQAYQAGNYQQAATHFKRVVQLDPANAKAWLFLGQSLAQTNDNMGARKAFAQVLALQPGGAVAERAGEQLAKLPEPDLFTLQLDSGITLGDWMKLARKQVAAGKRDAVLGELGQYLTQFGPVPQLLALQEQLQKEVQAEQEQKLKSAIADIKLTDAASAKTALPQIRSLRQQAPNSLKLIQLEARACHMMQDFACAEKSYTAWLKAAPGNDPKRESMVAALMQAKQHEALKNISIAAATGEIIRDCPECPEMVVISAGSFEMGEPNAKHTVTFAQPFAIGKTEVTQGQWKAIMGNNPSNFSSCGDNCPVEQVSWNDAQEFIKKLNAKTGKRYRLPSEAEWEAACRGGEQQEYCGSDNLDSVGWYGAYATPAGNSAKTTNPVATKQANAWGLYDMSGNVWEWVEDSWHDSYSGAPSDGTAWQGDGAKRVLRGGYWDDEPRGARSARRGWIDAAFRSSNGGFRLARTLP